MTTDQGASLVVHGQARSGNVDPVPKSVTQPCLLVLFGHAELGAFNQVAVQAAESLRAQGVALDVCRIAQVDAQARTDQLRSIVTQANPGLVVVHGGQGDVPVGAIAPEFPRTQFAVTQGSVQADNVALYEVLQEQSAFLAGILAGLRGGVAGAGHLSGERVKPGLKGRAAFVDGVRQAHAGQAVQVHTLFCGSQHDPELAAQAGRLLAERGARVVFSMLDRGRSGLTQVCRDLGLWQIGNVVDWVAQDPQVFLASALADSGWCVRQAVHDYRHGALPLGSKTCLGLELPDIVGLRLGSTATPAEREVIDTWTHRLLNNDYAPALTYEGSETV